MSQKQYIPKKKQEIISEHYKSKQKTSSSYYIKNKKELVTKLKIDIDELRVKRDEAIKEAIRYKEIQKVYESLQQDKLMLETKKECEFWAHKSSKYTKLIHNKQLQIDKIQFPQTEKKQRKNYVLMIKKGGPSDQQQ